MATSVLSPIDELSVLEAPHDAQEINDCARSNRENALSLSRPYSPSAASSVGTGRIPSLFTLDIGRPTTWDEPAARDRNQRRRTSRFNWQNPLARKESRPNQPLDVPVKIVAGKNDERRWEALATLDTQSTCNLVSTQTVEKQTLEIEPVDKLHFANTTAGQPMYCLGYIDMRLHCQAKNESLSDRGFAFRPKYYDMRFLVVDSKNFEVVVGHRTMDHEDIYRGDDLIPER